MKDFKGLFFKKEMEFRGGHISLAAFAEYFFKAGRSPQAGLDNGSAGAPSCVVAVEPAIKQ